MPPPGRRGNAGWITSLLKLSAESLFTTLFPADCRLCQAPLLSVSRLPVCPKCLASIVAVESPSCAVCGDVLASRAMAARGPDQLSLVGIPGAGELCGVCQKVRPAFDRAVAFGDYQGSLRELIHLLKYDRVLPAATPLARHLITRLRQGKLIEDAAGAETLLVVPVPLHRTKFRDRSFNQAEEIARHVARLAALPLSVHALARRRATQSQTGMSVHQRRENVRGAFAVRPRGLSEIRGRSILLVDDVYTTGATVSECARVLRRAGAARVVVATVARVSRMAAEPVFDQSSADQSSAARRAMAQGG